MTIATNFTIEENDVAILSKVASAYSITITELVKRAIYEYVDKIKKDPFYRLTANIEEASPEESAEIIEILDNLSEDDLEISSVKKFSE